MQMPTNESAMEKLGRLREIAKSDLKRQDEIVRKQRLISVAIQALQIILLGAIIVLAFAMKPEGDVWSVVIAILAALAVAITGFLFGSRSQFRLGQYLVGRHELQRQLTELDLVFHGGKDFEPQEAEAVYKELKRWFARQQALLETMDDHSKEREKPHPNPREGIYGP
jgi:uncharacterized membrane protein YfbV (UPF0208 family)